MEAMDKLIEAKMQQAAGYPGKPIELYEHRWKVRRAAGGGTVTVCSDVALDGLAVEAAAGLAGEGCERIDIYPAGSGHACVLHCGEERDIKGLNLDKVAEEV